MGNDGPMWPASPRSIAGGPCHRRVALGNL